MKKLITTKSEKQLAIAISFTGKYAESLLTSARRSGLRGETAAQLYADIRRQYRRNEAARAARFNMTRAEYLRLQAKAQEILADFDTGHSMGCYKYLTIKGKRFATADNAQEYAKSSKYRAQHGVLTIELTKADLRRAEKIGGLWTMPRAGNRARWIEETGGKQFHKIEIVDGYLIGTSHATTRAEALKLEAAKRIQRKRDAAHDQKFVGLQHGAKIGACRPGMEAFARRHNLDPQNGYRVDYLKSLHDAEADKYLSRI